MNYLSAILKDGTKPSLLVAALAVVNRISFDEAARATIDANGVDTVDDLAELIPGNVRFSEDAPWIGEGPDGITQTTYEGIRDGRIPFPTTVLPPSEEPEEEEDDPPAPAPAAEKEGGGGLLIVALVVGGLFLLTRKKR